MRFVRTRVASPSVPFPAPASPGSAGRVRGVVRRRPLASILPVVVLLLGVAGPAAGQSVTIDFEQFSGPSVFTSADPPLTVDVATFTGGQLLNAATFLPADPSNVYGTAFFCSGCLPTLTIDFSEPVSDVSFLLLNGQTFVVTYFIMDDQGDMHTISLAPNFDSGAGIVSLASDGVMMVTISGNTGSWDFLIDNVTYTRGRDIEITLDPEPTGGQYVIDATPTMPMIRATAKVVGVTPDPTPDTTFTWKASLAVDERMPAQEVLFDDDIVQDTTTQGEDPYLLELTERDAIRGGRLKLKASATVDGEMLEGETEDGLKVDGTNPQRSAIQDEIEMGVGGGVQGLDGDDVTDALQRVACQESNQRQFSAVANGGVGGPLISFDDGVGIFQITRTTNCPDPFQDCRQVLFDWRENVEEGIANFGEKVGPGRRYPGALRGGRSTYPEFIRNTINPMRRAQGLRPIPGIPAPPFSTDGLMGDDPPNRLLEDAVRGVNGFAGTLFGLVLHEFAPDTDFLLTVPNDELPGLNTDARVWRRVPAGERPNVGDPNYVANVTGQSPQCGG